MRALVLDFDGVISDSARESFAVSLATYLQLRPESALATTGRDTLFERFVELMPLGNRAEDYGATLLALDRGIDLPDQQAYDRHRAGQDAGWLADYHRGFYRVRQRMTLDDPGAWRALMQPYPRFVELLRRRSGSVAYAIATSKDRRSVDLLLAHYGIAELFPGELILDKQCGENKARHLERLRERLRLDPVEMTFVDDKVNHLDRVAPLGIRCALAGWGYNGKREHRLARGRGYRVCTLDRAERVLFGD